MLYLWVEHGTDRRGPNRRGRAVRNVLCCFGDCAGSGGSGDLVGIDSGRIFPAPLVVDQGQVVCGLVTATLVLAQGQVMV